MAEGGRKDDEDNPFSFQNYVKKKTVPDTKSRQNETSPTNEVDIFDLPEIPSPKRDKSQLKIVEDVEKKNKKSQQKKDENPFSFKKFISANSNPAVGHSSKFYVNGSGIAPDVASDLPDFVQDHMNNQESARARTASSRSARSRTQSDISLPDFALDSGANLHEPSSPDNQNSFPSIDAIGNVFNRGGNTRFNRNVSLDDDDDSMSPGGASMSPRVLPDFLTDSSVLSNMNNNDGANHSNTSGNHRLHGSRPNSSRVSPNNNLAQEVKRLQEENERLREEIEEHRRLAEQESMRVADLLRDREKGQKKEAEETAAMSTMIQQVEANLITSTQRAVKAETTVTRLKQEMKTLQNEVSSLSAENEVLRSGHPVSADIHDQTKYVSQQLMAAANTAEQTLKQLIGGVDNLKLMSDILSSLGKVSTAPSPDSDRNTAEDGDKSHSTEKNDKPTG